MLKRIQLNSRTNRIDVFQRFPLLEVDKKYILTIDNVYIPPLDVGFIPNQPLFSLERRGRPDTQPCGAVGPDFTTSDEFKIVQSIFTPDKCKNSVELVYQINYFLRKFFSKMNTGIIPQFDDEKEIEDQPELFQPVANKDWFEEMNNENFALKNSIQCELKDSGVLSFKFTAAVQAFIVIKFTELGKKVLGSDKIYFAPMQVEIDEKFDYFNEQTRVVRGEAYQGIDDNVGILNRSVFGQNEYRPEIVITTTLPVQNTTECNANHAKVRSQLTTYRYPTDKLNVGYNMVKFKHFSYSTPNRLLFEQNNRTNNKFMLTGTELQNFHLVLSLRQFEYNTVRKEFDEKLTPYTIDNDHHWSITFLINQTNV
jgi:hypothetical protein